MIAVQLGLNGWRNSGQWFDAAAGVLPLVAVESGGRVAVAQNGRRLAGAVRFDDANHDMADLHFPGFDPGAGIVPELVAVRAVGVGEGVEHARRLAVSIGDPETAFQLLPQRLTELFVQAGLIPGLPLAIQHGADNGLLAVGGEVDGLRPAQVERGVAGHPAGGGEAVQDFIALLLQRLQRRWQGAGRGGERWQAEWQGQ
ncbi:Uncharacterised protein [Chromobacterium vaccinii]|nr:hypothetical protein [Chromobacterium vaccinii]SUX54125.1 Uncharacterised protein [Chromobacterium vaccinii]